MTLGYPDEESQRQHLMECTDSNKHQEHKNNLQEKSKKEVEKQKKLDVQDSIQTQAAFTFLGSQSSQLYLLNEEQIRKQAIQAGVDCSGNKDEMIANIFAVKEGKHEQASSRSGSMSNHLLLTNANDDKHTTKRPAASSPSSSSSSSSSSSAMVTTNNQTSITEFKKRKRIHIDTLPSNLHSLSVAQLRSVCASNGLLSFLRDDMTKTEILDMMDDFIFDD